MLAPLDPKLSQKIREKKDHFLRALFHDVRTPLASVKEASSLLWEEVLGPLNESQKKCADIARTEILKVQNWLDLILDVSFLENDSMALSFEWVPMDRILNLCLSGLEKKCSEKGLKFEKKITEFSGSVFLDLEGFRKAFQFLSQEILRNTPPKSPLHFSFQEDGDRAFFEIRSVGEGSGPHPLLTLIGGDSFKTLWKNSPVTLSKGFVGLSLLELLGFGFEMEGDLSFFFFKNADPRRLPEKDLSLYISIENSRDWM